MHSIPLPTNVRIALDEENQFKGTLTIEPLYPGYGATIANSLRRVLLSSMPGASIYAFKIKGVEHEFKSVDYVKEDVVDISLNLKRVNLKSFSDEPVKLEIKATGEKIITAGDIEKNSDIEVVNPKQPILTLTDKAASIEMTLWVRQGRGYETVESRDEEEMEVNAIAIDSIFTPIVMVGYQVDNVRVGGRTDFDKITMQIESSGAISIEEAVKMSSDILQNHYATVIEAVSNGDISAEDSAEDASSESVAEETAPEEPSADEMTSEATEEKE